MSQSVSKGMGVSAKLQLPNLISLILLVVVAVMYFQASGTIEGLQDRGAKFNELTGYVSGGARHIQRYLENEISLEELEKLVSPLEVKKRADALNEASFVEQFDLVWKQITDFAAIQVRNKEIDGEITRLTQISNEQSDSFLNSTVERLVSEEERDKVSNLERMVIKGAHTNTASNLGLMIRFLRLKEDFSVKGEMTRYMDILIKNVEADIKALANTPFVDMALKAREANFRIKNLLLEYIKNVEAGNALRNAANSRLDLFMQNMQTRVTAMNQAFFNSIEFQFKVIMLIVLLGTVVGIVFLYISGRSISRIISMLTSGATALSRGDSSLTGLNAGFLEKIALRGDELGEIGRAFNALVAYLKNRSAALARVADGDLKLDVTLFSKADELGLSLTRMVDHLNHLLSQVTASTHQVETGATQISTSSQSLSEVTTRQAAALEQITASVVQMSAMVRQSADNAANASELADESKTSAISGNEQMREMVHAMEKINESGREISSIIKTIDNIAFQTNLLALNAAVEAARAGKHGKGFAVVAEEVRNLASRSAKAAKETAELIEGSVKRVEAGTAIMETTQTRLDEIVDRVSKVSDLVSEISTASNEQAKGIDQTNQGIRQIEEVTQQNAATAEETAAAAQELSGMSMELTHLLERFSLKDGREQPGGPADGEKDPETDQRLLLPEKEQV